jgi:excisionase family DNA binding protein
MEAAMIEISELEIRPNVYYTHEEAAKILRVSPRTVLSLFKRGAVQGIKIGREWRVLGSDLLRLPRTNDNPDSDLTREFMRMTESAFMKVWDNDEDAVYDQL